MQAMRPHSKKVFDTHLMIAPCDPYLEAFAKAGSDIITVHVESGPHVHRSLQAIRALGKKAGVTLNPGTPIETIENVIDLVDLILIMSVNPGFGGQAFIPAALDKIARARALVGARPIDIEIDGGVTPDNAAAVARAGANVLVAGSAVFKGGPDAYRAEHRGDPQCRRDGARGSRVNFAPSGGARSAPIDPPEPDLTPAAMIARATAMRGTLRDAQAECEAQGRVSDDVNDELIRAGFYRVIQPRCFGGYEFDVPTFYRVMMEIARGCPETGWVLALTAGHPLIMANFPLEGQARTLRTRRRIPLSGGVQPAGAAPCRSPGGYRVTASWPSRRAAISARTISAARSSPDADGKPTAQVIQVVLDARRSTASSTTGT